MSEFLLFDPSDNTLSVLDNSKVDYFIDNRLVTGDVELKKDTVVQARPKPGYSFPRGTDPNFEFKVNPVSSETAETPSVSIDESSVEYPTGTLDEDDDDENGNWDRS